MTTPVYICTGFLDSGKTTFIKRLARNVDQRFAILENEYGAAGIDGARLGQNRQGTQKNVWEMTEQCICCIGKKDFAASVLTIANVVDPEYLIVEPTGVGSLARIIENLRQIEYERIQLLSPVTIVDVYSYRRYMAEYPELYQDQIRSADTIIVSKTEACQAEEKQRIQKFLQEINPQAKIITDYASTMTREDYQSLLLGGRIRRAAKRCRRPSPSKISEWRHRKPCGVFWNRSFAERLEISSVQKDSSQPETSFSNLMSPITATASPAQNRKTPARLRLSETILTKMRSGSILRNAPETRK